MKYLLILYIILYLLNFVNSSTSHNSPNYPHTPPQKNAGVNIVYSLINRTIGDGFENSFKLGIFPNSQGSDYFFVGTNNGQVTLIGNNPVNLAQAFQFYLKYHANCSVTWTGGQCKLKPGSKLPLPGNNMIDIPHKYRYYMNVCTFGYSTVWWDWARWEKEIDWMALNGYNLVLAQVGQEYVWNLLFLELGLNQDDINHWFTGPAFLPWNRMGNLDGWGGVLPQSWIIGQYELQVKILKRMSEYGISPVLPGFAGHVPAAFKQFFPSSVIVELPTWHGFNSTHHLLTTDPMYDIIADRYYKIQNDTFGKFAKINFISVDPFNELVPPSNASKFLSECSNRIHSAINRFNPNANWVLQNWFLNNKFWGDNQIYAFMSGVPIGRLIVLDLWSEVKPLWSKTDSYYGHHWIWNMLHNFGGRPAISGRIPNIASAPLEAKSVSPSMIGVGLTPEAIEQNVIVYDLMSEMGWRSQDIDINSWVEYYLTRRYGKISPYLLNAWNMMIYTVYNTPSRANVCHVTKKPSLDLDLSLYYNPQVITDLWREMLLVDSQSIKSTETFKFDLADVSLQGLSNCFNKNIGKLFKAYWTSDFHTFHSAKRNCSNIIQAMDMIASTNKLLLFGKWSNDARKWATCDSEKKLYEYNARNQVTLWGWKNIGVPDYANKWWQGLLADYYLPRWNIFFEYLDKALFDKSKYDEHSLLKRLAQYEEKWNKEMKEYPYETLPENDIYTISKAMFQQFI